MATKSKSRNSSKSKKRVEKSNLKSAKVRALKRFGLRFAIALTLLIFLVPGFLLVVYRFEFVHPVSTIMIREALVGAGAKREWMEIDDMAPVLYQSVLSSEDGKFCSHGGVDWQALNSVIEDAIDGERTRGASTITMQLVKNLFLWPDRSYIRKILEVPYAIMADLILPKKRIMEIYLNIAEWDEGVFGAEAASQTYFKRSAAKLSRRQASLLAVTLPNPRGRNAAKPTRSMNRVANIVQRRARQSGAYVQCLK